jgi:type II secretory pathway component PulF
MKLSGISEVAEAGMPQKTVAAPVAKPIKSASTVQVPTVQRSAPVPSKPVLPTNNNPIRTKWASDKDLFFLFSQISSYLKSGVNPAQAYTNLATNMARTKFRDALQDCANDASKGLSIATTFQKYPFLFPPHIVGMYRAGEIGGFLPQACEAISEQANNSHKFKKWYFWLGIFFISVLACLPVMVWGLQSLMAFWDKSASGDAQSSPFKVMGATFFEQFVKSLPLFLGSTLVVWIFYRMWQSMPNRALRHKLVLFVPTTAKRAKLESMTVFAWTLSNLFKSGIAPKTAVEAAASVMPNLQLATKMLSAANAMRAETKLSQVVQDISMLTPEMSSIVATGEYVGDLPGALASVAESQRAEFSSTDKASQMRIGCWMLLLIMGGSLLILAGFYRLFMDGMMEKISEDPPVQMLLPL